MEALAAQSALFAFAVLALGLAVLLVSANYFVEGIAAIASILGVPPLVIGMTLVAFGTSTPELVINGLAASRGETALAFGNIVGACTLNVGFVLAITAIVRPLRVEPSIITREIPMLWLGVIAILILGADKFFDPTATVNSFNRADGLILLLLFGIFIYYTVIYSMASRAVIGFRRDAFLEQVAQETEVPVRPAIGRHTAITLIALGGVSLSADWTVSGATGLARFLGLSENIIGLTIVALGTTLPEMLTCVLAARRGNADIALGNVLGSNIFNLLAIGGMVSFLSPVVVPQGGALDLFFMAFLALVLLPIAIRSGLTITRGEGVFLLAANIAYLLYRLFSANLPSA
jgi:cation:H+ antiporter